MRLGTVAGLLWKALGCLCLKRHLLFLTAVPFSNIEQNESPAETSFGCFVCPDKGSCVKDCNDLMGMALDKYWIPGYRISQSELIQVSWAEEQGNSWVDTHEGRRGITKHIQHSGFKKPIGLVLSSPGEGLTLGLRGWVLAGEERGFHLIIPDSLGIQIPGAEMELLPEHNCLKHEKLGNLLEYFYGECQFSILVDSDILPLIQW